MIGRKETSLFWITLTTPIWKPIISRAMLMTPIWQPLMKSEPLNTPICSACAEVCGFAAP